MAIIPKPASTVVLLDSQSRVYLTKRPITMKFLGGYYVFPGGTVDKADSSLDENYIIQRMQPTPSFDYYVAAARELFEEVGVLLARNKEGDLPSHLDAEKKQHYRQQLVRGKMTFLDFLKSENLFFHLNELTYFGTLVTPEWSPQRFDTSFFVAHLPEGQSPEPDEYEIDDAFWTTPNNALADYERGKLPMIPPTILSLQTIIDHQKGQPLQLPKNPKML